MVWPILPEPSEEQFRTGGRHTAYRDQCRPAFEGDAEVFVGFDAATEVYCQAGGRSQAFQYFMVDDMFGSCPVEVHDVQTFEAVTFKFPCHGYRVFVVGLLRGVISFGQPYAFAVYQVYGRYQFDHTVKSKKFFNMRSPTLPLFSGWNCVA